jgi:two-component system, NtrC family, nitrogen regulation response regulator NtrX
MPETILIVDDEDSVRRTFRDWLQEADLGCTILTAGDAESALNHAQSQVIDLAVLDWNLGTGMDGLRLLEYLEVFCPDIVAILVTGYAHQATPLMALRMGVRDYLDKNHELNRSTFIASVKRQLDKVRPAKQQRELHDTLSKFRSSVEQILPIVRSAAVLNDPTPMSHGIAALCNLAKEITEASDAVLVIRSNNDFRAYSLNGSQLPLDANTFSRSLAASALSLGEPRILAQIDSASMTGVEPLSFERNRKNLLAVPLPASGGISAVLELFDKSAGFTERDRKLGGAVAVVGAELLQQAISERHTYKTLFDAVEAAMHATESMKGEVIAESVRVSLRQDLHQPGSSIGGAAVLELAEAVQSLAVKYGEPAVRHCRQLIDSVAKLLDSTTDV